MTTFNFRIFILLLSLYPAALLANDLKGVGRNISAQVFDNWGKQFSAQYTETSIKYAALNAKEAIKQVEQTTADFSETDTPLSKKELDEHGLTQFPYMFTAITPVVNLPNIFNAQLKLDGKTLGDIFLGKITKWNDPAIVATNPRLPLPDENILVFYGAEGSGGTYSMNNYLSKVNADWKAKAEAGSATLWPVGTPMADLITMGIQVKNTPYSIGYTEISFARKNEATYIQLQNSHGKFVSPHTGSIESSVQNVNWKASNGFIEDITNDKGAASWPITSASYIIIKKTSDNVKRRLELLKFIGWGLTRGDMIVTNLDFMPLNRKVFTQIRTIWNDTPLRLEGAEVVDAKQVLELRSDGIMIVDSRVAPEFKEDHIPKAVNIPYVEKSEKSANFDPGMDQFDLSKLPANKNAGIIFYCNAGACWKGYKAAVVAVKAGYRKVYWFRGGIPEWKSRSYPTESALSAVAKN
ncbi:MAG: phosphate ABC transporter substrate-binding protein PstS [Gallionellaceae bacterium]|jgi:phosphate transport system substrate-binding protein